jgi:nicotinate phosphoribosyltransferase
MFHVADPSDILKGKITDVYFERTVEVLKAKDINPVVRAEFMVKSFPKGWPWGLLAGLEEALGLLRNLPVTVRALKEGMVFFPYEPVLEIEGNYQDFSVFETAVLGFLCQASGVATRAARFKNLAGKRSVLSFGARRMHPILAPMIERNAFIGGCDGVAVVKSAENLGVPPSGTIPHALVLCFGSTVEAVRAFDEVIDPGVPRVALIDTFNDEKFECINVAEALGKKLFGVRFDTPSSRRGDFYRLLAESRWELDMRGYSHVKFFVSGGIKEEDVPRLNPVVDGYGIGTSISNAPVLDFAMDIIEVDGSPRAKRGKRSGSKRLLRCPSCMMRKTVVNDRRRHVCPSCKKAMKDILLPVLSEGRLITKPERPEQIRKRALREVDTLENAPAFSIE